MCVCSHFYLAVLSGCVPVIFDDYSRESARLAQDKKHNSSHFFSGPTRWAWRIGSKPLLRQNLNYSEFSIVYTIQNESFWKRTDILRELVRMPSEQPARYQALREGLDRAALRMRYALKDCQDVRARSNKYEQFCDAFSAFKALLVDRVAAG